MAGVRGGLRVLRVAAQLPLPKLLQARGTLGSCWLSVEGSGRGGAENRCGPGGRRGRGRGGILCIVSGMVKYRNSLAELLSS